MRALPCPVCFSDSTHAFLRRENVPVHQNVVMRDQAGATLARKHALHMAVCSTCGFVFNQAFDLSKLAYGDDYDNTQACSSFFSSYLDDLLRYLLESKQVENSRIIEVGCGQGQFLRRLVEPTTYGNTGHGFDPSYVGPEQDLDGRLTFHKRYYGPDCADVLADVVLCRHVIEHVPDPVGLLRSVRAALSQSPKARIYFETPCVDWILRNRVIWDFFYEHCSLFTERSLKTAFERAGFSVERVRHVFEGQYLWIEATVADQSTTHVTRAGETPALADAFATSEAKLAREWTDLAQRLAAGGRLAIWGAGAKGSTFLHLIDSDRRLIDSVIDINPNKQGCYIAGTGHPIIDFKQIVTRGITDVILMNPNYRHEIKTLLDEHNIRINLLERAPS